MYTEAHVLRRAPENVANITFYTHAVPIWIYRSKSIGSLHSHSYDEYAYE